MNKFYGILKASPEKRYKNFISTVADREEVWMLSNDDGYASIEDDYINLLVFPEKEYAKVFCDGEIPVPINIHDFCDRCSDLDPKSKIRFMVFPNGANAFVVDGEKIFNDIMEELDKIE